MSDETKEIEPTEENTKPYGEELPVTIQEEDDEEIEESTGPAFVHIDPEEEEVGRDFTPEHLQKGLMVLTDAQFSAIKEAVSMEHLHRYGSVYGVAETIQNSPNDWIKGRLPGEKYVKSHKVTGKTIEITREEFQAMA